MAVIDDILNESTTKIEKPIKELSEFAKDKINRAVIKLLVINLQIGDKDYNIWVKSIRNIKELDNYLNEIDKKYSEVIL